ncbi:Beta-lactamase domain-containing protein 2 [Dirofilaria immitis]|nr:Beta-lactamase domain-containing protein 2 [Dirofilaria immitis]
MAFCSTNIDYQHLRKAFMTANLRMLLRQNFEKGLEREGAHLTVIQNGKIIINLWNGYSDSESLREWNQNTKTALFSTTKAITALCLAMQVDRGHLSYNDLVVKYWPEYGQHGKHLTTIEDILTHKFDDFESFICIAFEIHRKIVQAGIPYLENITMADMANEKDIMEKIEKAKPLWKPGTATGYHAVTFGWLVDGIFRKVDEKGRSVKTFLQEEIANKYGIDIAIGLTKHEFKNLARITQPGLLEYARDIFMDLRVIAMLAIIYAQPSNSLAARIRIHPSWLPMNFDTVALNDPNIIELNMPAITGVSDAFNLAKLFSLAIDGTLLSNRTLAQITQPTTVKWHLEQVFLYPFVKGRGFFFEKHPVNTPEKEVTVEKKCKYPNGNNFRMVKRLILDYADLNSYLFGHPGYGCQALDIDFDNKLVIVYVSNGLKTGSGKICKTYQSLLRSLYRSL